MGKRIAAWIAGLCLVLPCFMLAGFGQAAPVPVEAFARLPTLSQPAVSPDGKYIAVIRPYKGTPIALIYDLSGSGEKPTFIPYTNGFIVGVQWANNDRLLITVNSNAAVLGDSVNAWYRIVSVDARGQQSSLLLKNIDSRDNNYSAAAIADLALDDPDHIYMPLWTDFEFLSYTRHSDFRKALYKVDVNSGVAHLIEKGTSKTDEFIMDGHGAIVARVDTLKDPLKDVLYLYRNGSWTEVAQFNAEGGRGSGIAGLSQTGDALIRFAANEKTGTTGLVSLNLSDDKSESVFVDADYDVGNALSDPWTGRIIGVSVTGNMSRDRYFEPEMQALQKGLEAAFPGNSVHAVSWDLTKRKMIVAVDGPRMPRSYFLLDRTSHEAQFITSTYPELKEENLGEMRNYPYPARDGLKIDAYLTLPPGKAAKNLPTVVMPHGGPMARDSLGFDWMAQFLANRGYAVLQPNFRGSSGYGEKFLEAGYGQWGLKMQDDVTDGVKKLIADGIADPKRICIVGGSYGGYAALAGAAFTPELYACAASWAGVTDLRQFLATRALDYGGDSWMVSSWSRFIGNRSEAADKLDAASPAKNAGRIECPILLMHGTADNTVRIDQSEVMQDALKSAGKKVVFVPIKDETHYMQSAATRTRVLTELEKFLAENIGE
jgi:dipeptidyl aminopeptidase/acylaminoacyl peptidase